MESNATQEPKAMTLYTFAVDPQRGAAYSVNEPTEAEAREAVARYFNELGTYLFKIEPADLVLMPTAAELAKAAELEAKIAAERIVNAACLQAELEAVEAELSAIRTRARNAGLDALAGVVDRAHRPVHLATIAARQATGQPAF